MTVSQVTLDDRPALRIERRFDHRVERVWRAVTEPAELERWFVAPVPWTPELGEAFEAAGESGRITELDPPTVLAWTWGIERYRFELSAVGDACVLAFTHVFNPELGPSWQHAAGWETYFNRLEVHLTGGFLSEEDAHVEVDALMAHYRARFEALPEG